MDRNPFTRGALHAGLFGMSAALLVLQPPAVNGADLGVIRVESSAIDDRPGEGRGEPSSVQVISGKQVDAAHAENIRQILQSVPGITAEVQSGDSVKIHIRGVENQRFMGEKPGVAVVIDGVPVFERTGRVNIDLDDIESIKVIKGGASYLFGEDALAGAVVITTKRGAGHAGYKGAAEAGSFGYYKALARVGHAGDELNFHLQASRRRSDGYYFQSGYRADYLAGKLQYYLNDLSDLTFGLELSERAKDSHGTVTGVTQAAEDPRSVEGRDYVRKFDVNLDKYFLTYSRDLGKSGNLMVNAYRFGDHTRYVSSPVRYDAGGAPVTDVDAYTTGNDYRQVQRGLKGELRRDDPRLAWLAGLDLRANTYDKQAQYITDFKQSPSPSAPVLSAGTPIQDNATDEAVQAAYGELKLSPAKDVILTLNGRFDHIGLEYADRLTGGADHKGFKVGSWRLGGNYALAANLHLYANVSTGFRAPTVEQLFVGSGSLGGNIAPNPGLRPERAINKELGLRAKTRWLGAKLAIDLALFQIDRRDFILASAGQYSKPTGGDVGRFDNIGGARHRGLELSLTGDRTQRLSWDLAYTYLDAVFTRYDNFNLILGNPYSPAPGAWTTESFNNTGKRLPRVPRHHLNLNVRFRPKPGLTVSGEMDSSSGYYADEINRVRIGGHTVYNLLINYDRKSGHGTQWSFFARIDNLFDRTYYNTARGFYDANYDKLYNAEDISIVVNPGRTWTLGVAARL